MDKADAAVWDHAVGLTLSNFASGFAPKKADRRINSNLATNR